MPSPTKEDYLEKIWLLHTERGFARTSDLAEQMNVRPSTVSRMMRRLYELGLVVYRKYRKITLTEKGVRLAQIICGKHRILENFLFV